MLVKRPGYAWASGDRANQGDAHLDEIDFKIIPEASVRTGALQSGQVAAIGGVPPQDIATLARRRLPDRRPRRTRASCSGSAPCRTTPRSTTPASARRSPRRSTSPRSATPCCSDDFAVAKSVLSQTTPGFVAVPELIAFDTDSGHGLLDAGRMDQGQRRRARRRTARSCTSCSAG